MIWPTDYVDKIICGDCLDILQTIPDRTIQTCITSPPYWGLRDYGTATWEGGDPECAHKAAKEKSRYDYAMPESAQCGTHKGMKEGTDSPKWKDTCPDCGAVKIDAQLGLEKTPEEYVSKMVTVFREVRRVLKDDGTLWLNLGDSYSSGGRGSYDKSLVSKTSGLENHSAGIDRATPLWAKPKDLLGIPWRVAFALQSDGWYLRSDIIWSKPNPMPESVTDRPTKAHEYLFLMSKSQKYYYDADAIKEKSVTKPHSPGWSSTVSDRNDRSPDNEANQREWGDGKSNKRSVWNIATQPFPEAHFAVMPEKLVEPCVLAGSREGDIVLDPFAGAGTVPYVAKEFQRQYIGIELNAEYIKIAEKRLVQKTLDLTNQFD